MKVEVDLKRKYVFIVIGLVLVLVAAIGVYAGWDNTKKVWHDAMDVKVNLNGVDYDLNETVNSKLCQSDGKNCASGSQGAAFANKNYPLILINPNQVAALVVGVNYIYDWITVDDYGATSPEHYWATGSVVYRSNGVWDTRVVIDHGLGPAPSGTIDCDSGLQASSYARCNVTINGQTAYVWFSAPFGDHAMPALRGRTSRANCAQEVYDYPNDTYQSGGSSKNVDCTFAVWA